MTVVCWSFSFTNIILPYLFYRVCTAPGGCE